MERNTVTTLNELQAGDRFYFRKDRHKAVYEVIAQLSAHAEVNEVRGAGFLYKNPLLRKHNCEVVFLRHTAVSIHEKDELTGIV